MSEENAHVGPFVSLKQAAARLGVPAAWLRSEALAGRVPHLQAGRRLLLNIQLVEKVLLLRAHELSGKGVKDAL